jgi:hypothetical protein
MGRTLGISDASLSPNTAELIIPTNGIQIKTPRMQYFCERLLPPKRRKPFFMPEAGKLKMVLRGFPLGCKIKGSGIFRSRSTQGPNDAFVSSWPGTKILQRTISRSVTPWS